MKKIITLVTGLAAICALTACNAENKGKEVKPEEFKQKANKIEDHEYSQATIKYTYVTENKVPNTGLLFDGETGSSDDETGSLNGNFKGEAVFTLKDGEWTTTDENAQELFGDSIGVSLKAEDFDLDDFTAELEVAAKEYNIKSSLKYFVDPLGLEVTAKGDFAENELGTTGSVDIYEYVAFDSYGYITKLDTKIDIKSTLKIADKAYESTFFTDAHATITYK